MKAYHTLDSLKLGEVQIFSTIRQGDFPRYLVAADGVMTPAKTSRALARILSTIYSEPPHVFRNAGGGLTLDFDNN